MKEEKVKAIIEFVTKHPFSNASRSILRRYYLNNEYFETGSELGIELKRVLKTKDDEEIDLCYDLIK